MCRLILVIRYQVLKKFQVGSWQRTAFDGFVHTLTSKRNNTVYPCIYGTKGYKDNSLVYLFLDSPDLNDATNVQLIAKAVTAYVPSAQAVGLISSMVIIAPNPDELLSVQGYQTMFWNFLKSVRRLDTKPWPQDISKDPLDDNWSFCFAGQPAFIVVCTPAHENRHSRWMPNLCLVYQPRWIFDIIMDSATKRKTAVKTIRNLVDKFDYPLSHSPDLANYGEPDTTESRQLFFLDENVQASCPFEDLEQ